MAIKEILLLGNPRLYDISEAVAKNGLNEVRAAAEDLHDTLLDFRKRFGAGRAIAAPPDRLYEAARVYVSSRARCFHQPRLENMSREMIEVWDDCMCFPELLVKVQRHKACTVRFLDHDWNERVMTLTDDLSELLQHEYDHLDGILAVSRALDGRSFALRNQKGTLK
jgi:peptide deformylase